MARSKDAADKLEAALVAGRTLAKELPDQLANFEAAVHRLPDGHTKESLFVLIDKTKREATDIQTQVAKLREEVEGWFNDAMDRVGGWYKRWTQMILLVLSTLIVFSLNVDTLLLVQHLSTDKDLRASILQKANDTKTLEQLRADASALSLPLGWSLSAKDDRRYPWITEDGLSFYIVWLCMKKLIGLFLTVAALSLGAPFWFDVLSKFINMRGAGTPPGEKKKSAPQSPAAQKAA